MKDTFFTTSYEGYLRRGLTLPDAHLAVHRFLQEWPQEQGYRTEIAQREDGLYRVEVYQEVRVPLKELCGRLVRKISAMVKKSS